MKNVRGEDSGIFRRKIEKETSEINYKTLTPADYDELWSLWNQVEQTKRALNSVDDSREGITRYMKRNPTTCFAATSGGKIIGAFSIAAILPPPLQKPLIQSKWHNGLENAGPDRFGDTSKMRRD